MAKFSEAFKRGLENAEKASKSRERIDAVVGELSKDVVSASNGKIAEIAIKECERFVPHPNLWVINAAKLLGPPPGKTVAYTGLVASKKSDGKETVLCEFKISPTGFPVALVYSNRNVVCSDEKELASGLNGLLEHPDTGDLLQQLIGEAA